MDRARTGEPSAGSWPWYEVYERYGGLHCPGHSGAPGLVDVGPLLPISDISPTRFKPFGDIMCEKMGLMYSGEERGVMRIEQSNLCRIAAGHGHRFGGTKYERGCAK